MNKGEAANCCQRFELCDGVTLNAKRLQLHRIFGSSALCSRASSESSV